MRILLIHNHYEYTGGEDVAVNEEIKLLQEKNHEVEALFFDNKDINHSKNLVVTGIRSIYNTSSKRIIEAKIKSFMPEVIHLHNLFFLVTPSVFFTAKKFNIPVVLTLHNYRLICCKALLLRNNHVCEICVSKRFPFAGIKYKCYRSSHLQSAMVTAITGIHKFLGTWKNKVATYIALTNFAREKFLNSSLDLNPDQIEVVPNFVVDPGVGSTPRKNFFLFVGRLSTEKGLTYLLEFFSQFSEEEIVVAGEGPLEQQLRQRYFQSKNIKFLGKASKLKIMELMKECKALIFPSIWYEGLPFTIVEALSTATPVLASRLGSMAEIIEDGSNGFHFNVNDEKDLGRTVQRFNQLNEEEHQIMRAAARRSYELKYHPETHYQAIFSVYKKAIKKSKNWA